ncbi:hydroxyethylthiazole kinase [Marinobacterium weihaiense]|uniref:Hydroxyethylthiazole kinase n=1 Tax=Marinobacterium weihaiense TaxID=2851016 RepID=A0ABS6M9H3_9GAMM|nr:hydroxyethylthiazole kinase [Marinobacterium weihaiense]MBV0932934.1 hydroxyethylthiazole kinase [Marinobacterium weihaiense]
MNTTAPVIDMICNTLALVRRHRPLITNVTNHVVMNNTANALLALGASPIMAHSRQEMDELIQISGALVVNIGTLDSHWIERMHEAVACANRYHKPVVLDPVGAGASTLRTDTAAALARSTDQLIVRGNASEVLALAGQLSRSKGVDAQDNSEQALQAADTLLARGARGVLISGARDYSVTAQQTRMLENGHPLMPRVTGMGCTLSALTGAFAAMGDLSGTSAAAVLGVAGELAALHSAGPGSLQVNLLDTLYGLDEPTLRRHLRVTCVDRH